MKLKFWIYTQKCLHEVTEGIKGKKYILKHFYCKSVICDQKCDFWAKIHLNMFFTVYKFQNSLCHFIDWFQPFYDLHWNFENTLIGVAEISKIV